MLGENEYVHHMMFYCPGSRAIWFTLGLNLRVEEVPMQFKEALVFLNWILPPERMTLAANVMWCLWKKPRTGQ
jgi:hypothetical protein